METVDSEEVAGERSAAIARDYELLSVEGWCKKYHVAAGFAEG
jgi:hypothetical protein